MLEIRTKLDAPAGAGPVEVKGRLELSFDSRQKTRQRTRLVSGEEVALVLPRGEVLRGGDLVLASDGRVIEIVAAAEALLHVECASATELARCAYHLGNRHVPVEVGRGFLRLAEDHVLERMLAGLGAKLSHLVASFEPEAGAYRGNSGGGAHAHSDGHAAKIHDHHERRGHRDRER